MGGGGGGGGGTSLAGRNAIEVGWWRKRGRAVIATNSLESNLSLENNFAEKEWEVNYA